MKPLDHWPDFGSDLDLLTTSRESKIISLMRDRFDAAIETPSWSDRLARIPFGHLGQAGEQSKLSGRILQNRVQREFGGLSFWVAASEERIILVDSPATLPPLLRPHLRHR